MTTSEERLSRLEGVYEHLATKADIADLRTEFQTGMERQRSELQTGMERQRSEFQTGMEQQRSEFQTGMERQRSEFLTEMERQKVDLIKWMISLIVGASALGVAAVTTIIKFLS